MKINKFLAAGLISIALIALILLLAAPDYNRIDIIEKPGYMFKLSQHLSQAESSSLNSLIFHSLPDNISSECSQLDSFTIGIQNPDKKPAVVHLTAVNKESLQLYYPETFIIPPQSSRTMTIFFEMGCRFAPSAIPAAFSIKGTHLTFTTNIRIQ